MRCFSGNLLYWNLMISLFTLLVVTSIFSYIYSSNMIVFFLLNYCIHRHLAIMDSYLIIPINLAFFELIIWLIAIYLSFPFIIHYDVWNLSITMIRKMISMKFSMFCFLNYFYFILSTELYINYIWIVCHFYEWKMRYLSLVCIVENICFLVSRSYLRPPSVWIDFL